MAIDYNTLLSFLGQKVIVRSRSNGIFIGILAQKLDEDGFKLINSFPLPSLTNKYISINLSDVYSQDMLGKTYKSNDTIYFESIDIISGEEITTVEAEVLPFDPSHLEPLAWWDYLKADSVISNSDGLVSEWRDRSGNSWNSVQTELIDMPLLTKSGIRFKEKILKTTGSNLTGRDFCVFIVLSIGKPLDNNDYVFGTNGSDAQNSLIIGGKNQATLIAGQVNNSTEVTGAYNSEFIQDETFILSYHVTTTSSSIRKNNVLLTETYSVQDRIEINYDYSIGSAFSDALNRVNDATIKEIIVFVNLNELRTSNVINFLTEKHSIALFDLISLLPAAWFDASDGNTITKVDNIVSEWRDKSGNLKHIMQPIFESRPIFENGIISFDGTNDFMFREESILFTQADTVSLFFVGVAPSNSSGVAISEGNSAESNTEYTLFQSDAVDATRASFTVNNSDLSVAETELSSSENFFRHDTVKIYSVEDDGSTITTTVNGDTGNSIAYTRPTTMVLDRFSIACSLNTIASSFSDIKIKELVLFKMALEISEKNKIENYLSRKHGIPLVNATFVPIVSALTQIVGLNLLSWWDASDPSTITDTNGLVSEWRDKSGNGLHIKQSALSLQPNYDELNKKVTFTSGKFLSLFDTMPIRSIFIVYKDTNSANASTPFTGGIGDGIWHSKSGTDSIFDPALTSQVLRSANHYRNGQLFSYDNSPGTADDKPSVATIFNINSTGLHSGNVDYDWYIGSDRGLTNRQVDEIQEIITLDYIPSSYQRLAITNYLSAKHNIAIEFNILSLNPLAWWDALDDSTITKSSGGLVSQLKDKSGNEYHADQLTLASQPLKVASGIRFQSKFLQTVGNNLGASFTVIVAGSYTTMSLNRSIFGTSGANTATSLVLGEGGSSNIRFGSTTVNTTTILPLGKFLYSASDTGSGLNIRANGVQKTLVSPATFSAPSSDNYLIGAGFEAATIRGATDTTLFEVIVIAGSDIANIAAVENYLSLKYLINIYDPMSLTPRAWWDASDSSTITKSGTAVSQWRDKSGNNYHKNQPTAANQPAVITDGTGTVIDYDNVNDFFTYNVGTFTGKMGVATRSGSYVADVSYNGSFTMPTYQLFDVVAVIIAATIDETAFKDYAVTKGAVREFSAVTSLFNAFRERADLTSFPLINTASVNNLTLAWFLCTSLTSFPLLNTSSVTSMQQAWRGCTSLITFPLLNTSAVTSLQQTWQNCTSLATFPAAMFNNTPCTNFINAFTNTALTQTSIDNILVSINTANTSNGTFNQSGGSAPSSTGTAAITAMRGRGWTVTVTGGF